MWQRRKMWQRKVPAQGTKLHIIRQEEERRVAAIQAALVRPFFSVFFVFLNLCTCMTGEERSERLQRRAQWLVFAQKRRSRRRLRVGNHIASDGFVCCSICGLNVLIRSLLESQALSLSSRQPCLCHNDHNEAGSNKTLH